MTPAAQGFMRSLAARIPFVFAALLVLWVVAWPWFTLIYGGRHLLVRWYLLPYLFVLLGFALLMAVAYRRELHVRMQNWRAARRSTKPRDTSPADMHT
jgi:hypothetical protein